MLPAPGTPPHLALQEMREFLQILCSNDTKYEQERLMLQVYNGLSLHSIPGVTPAGRKHENAEVMDGHVLRGLCDSMHDLLLACGLSEDDIQSAPADCRTWSDIPDDHQLRKAMGKLVEGEGLGFEEQLSTSECQELLFQMARLACLRYACLTRTDMKK